MNKVWSVLFVVLLVALAASLVMTAGTYGLLNITRQELSKTEYELMGTQRDFAATTAELNETTADLIDTRALLTATKSQLTNTENQLTVVKSELIGVKSQLTTAVDVNDRMVDSYVSLRDEVDVRLGSTSAARQSFVTPSDPEVAAIVQQVTAGFLQDAGDTWRSYERIYRWVKDNIEYSPDTYTPFLPSTLSGNLEWSKEFWRTPAETLSDKAGDCEDMALLLTSMMRNFNKGGYSVWLITISSTTEGVAGHMAVAFPVYGDKLSILDPAGSYFTGYRTGKLGSEGAAVEINTWLTHWSTQIQGAYINSIFSETIDEKFKTTEEFLLWLNQE